MHIVYTIDYREYMPYTQHAAAVLSPFCSINYYMDKYITVSSISVRLEQFLGHLFPGAGIPAPDISLTKEYTIYLLSVYIYCL